MTVIPRYDYPVGTRVTLHERSLVLKDRTKLGYTFSDSEGQETFVMGYKEFVRHQKDSATRIDADTSTSRNVLRLRLGVASSRLLSKASQGKGLVRFALAAAVADFRRSRSPEAGGKPFSLSIRMLNRPENRQEIQRNASRYLGESVRLERPRGGSQATNYWPLPKGRTLLKYLSEYDAYEDDDDRLDALVTLDHLKGNRTSRICWKVRELMFKSIEEVRIDARKINLTQALRLLDVRIDETNTVRRQNDLPTLIVPSLKTLSAFEKEMLTPTELLIAREGRAATMNKRGRGSTDIRALLIGELVEIDECKVSVVASAKAGGFWNTLSSEERQDAEACDEEIRRRFTILVMIDVASRMPLAWIVSEEPRHEATLALLRMATRDKTREKTQNGCSGDPVPAIGLLNVKNDNGTALRHSAVKRALIPTARGADSHGILELTVF